MRRREFITLLGGAAAAWPLAARAQQLATPVVGYLRPSSADAGRDNVAAFLKGLSETGFVEGKSVMVEYRWADALVSRLPSLAADLVRRKVAVIVETGALPLASPAATATIPIVFVTPDDPVKFGLVASLNRPGGNLTGITRLTTEVLPKLLELLHELLPAAGKMALLVDPTNPTAENQAKIVQAAARTLAVELEVLNARSEDEIDQAFASVKRSGAAGLVIAGDALFARQIGLIATLAARYAVPAIFQNREYALGGGLMSYGGSRTDGDHLAGTYAGRILKGEKPAELPVQQSSKFDLVINLRMAKTLGVTMPISLLARADEVVE